MSRSPKKNKHSNQQSRGLFGSLVRGIFSYPMLTSSIALFFAGAYLKYTEKVSDENLLRIMGLVGLGVVGNEFLHAGNARLNAPLLTITSIVSTENNCVSAAGGSNGSVKADKQGTAEYNQNATMNKTVEEKEEAEKVNDKKMDETDHDTLSKKKEKKEEEEEDDDKKINKTDHDTLSKKKEKEKEKKEGKAVKPKHPKATELNRDQGYTRRYPSPKKDTEEQKRYREQQELRRRRREEHSIFSLTNASDQEQSNDDLHSSSTPSPSKLNRGDDG